MSSREEAGEDAVDDLVVSHHGLADLGADLSVVIRELLDRLRVLILVVRHVDSRW